MKRIAHFVGGAMFFAAIASGAALAETPIVSDAVAVVSAYLPEGVTLQDASVRELSRAVRRTVRAHPELVAAILLDVTKAVPPGRKKAVKKAVADAKAPYARTTGRGGRR